MLKSGKYSNIKKLDHSLYKATGLGIAQLINTGDNQIEIINQIMDIAKSYKIDINQDEVTSYLQMCNARRQQASRIYRHIQYGINKGYQVVFATFTFNNEALKLSELYRKKYIQRLLASNNVIVDYIGNIDYGDINEREHYHYILFISPDYELKTQIRTIKSKTTRKYISVENLNIAYDKGFTTYELVGTDDTDNKKIAKYVAKLTMHSIKVHQTKIITKKDSSYHQFQTKWNRKVSEYREAKNDIPITKAFRNADKKYQEFINSLITDDNFMF